MVLSEFLRKRTGLLFIIYGCHFYFRKVYLDLNFVWFFSKIFDLKKMMIFYLQQSRGCGMYWKNKENIFQLVGAFFVIFAV